MILSCANPRCRHVIAKWNRRKLCHGPIPVGGSIVQVYPGQAPRIKCSRCGLVLILGEGKI